MEMQSVREQDLADIQTRAEAFVGDQAKRLATQLPKFGVSAATLNKPSNEQQTREKLLAFGKDVDRAIIRERPGLASVLESINNCGRKELAGFLASSSTYLAGAQRYVDALQGENLTANRTQGLAAPSGVTLFELLFCHNPLAQSLEDVFKTNLTAILEQHGVQDYFEKEKASRIELFSEIIETLSPIIMALPPGADSPARFCILSLKTVLNHLVSGTGEEEQAKNLIVALANEFSRESSEVFEIIEKLDHRRERIEDQVTTEYGWLRRRVTRRAEYRERRRQLESLSQEMDGLTMAWNQTHQLFAALVNEVILPYWCRTKINRKFQDEMDQAARDFSEFVATISHEVGKNWDQAEVITEYRTPTKGTVLTRSKLDTLYQGALNGKSMAQLSKETLAFLPEAGLEALPEGLSYQACRNLGDHYLASPRTLLDRMADYSIALFDPIGRLETLDIVELNGKDEAFEYLQDTVEKTRRFLGFSAGMIPMVKDPQVMKTIFVVRAAHGRQSRLATQYGHLFQPQCVNLNGEDPRIIDLTCLIFGFPAFVIHVLDECSKLAYAYKGALAMDLFPSK